MGAISALPCDVPHSCSLAPARGLERLRAPAKRSKGSAAAAVLPAPLTELSLPFSAATAWLMPRHATVRPPSLSSSRPPSWWWVLWARWATCSTTRSSASGASHRMVSKWAGRCKLGAAALPEARPTPGVGGRIGRSSVHTRAHACARSQPTKVPLLPGRCALLGVPCTSLVTSLGALPAPRCSHPDYLLRIAAVDMPRGAAHALLRLPQPAPLCDERFQRCAPGLQATHAGQSPARARGDALQCMLALGKC